MIDAAEALQLGDVLDVLSSGDLLGRALAACFASDDRREGVASFLERRPAVFTGR